MSDNNGMPDVPILGAGAQIQRDRRQVQQAIEQALHNPHEVREVLTSACGVAELGEGQKAIVVAKPEGCQLRIRLTDVAARDLAKSLVKELENGDLAA